MSIKRCSNCHYWQAEVCCNSDSEHCADYRLSTDTCPQFEMAMADTVRSNND